MSILLVGSRGQVGSALHAVLPHAIALHRATLDVTDRQAVRDAIDRYQPSILINAAAYTAVDNAESEPDLAMRINADAVATMADAMKQRDGWLIHYSTDYVFDGASPAPYREEDPVAPLNVYGRSKALGEMAVRDSGVLHLILRTSWVYSTHGRNFPTTMLDLARDRERLRVVADQYGAPTHAHLIAEVTAALLPHLSPTASGTYHLSAGGATSWHGFAEFLFAQARAHGIDLRVRVLEAIATDEYPTPAQRPLNSRLCCDKLQQRFSLMLPDWQHHARAFVQDYAKAPLAG